MLTRLCTTALLLIGATHARAGWRTSVATEAGSGVGVEISSPFEHSPPTGCLPLWVTIRNDSGAARTWTITCDDASSVSSNGSRQTSTDSLRVENGQVGRLPVLLVLTPSSYGYYYQTNFVHVDGYGIDVVQTPLPGVNATGRSTPTHAVGMSEALATPIWTSLTKLYADAGQNLMGTPVDLALLSGDWRALVGLDTCWLTDADFNALDAPRRTAIRDWVSHGGRLYVLAQTADPSLRAAIGLPVTGDEADAGLGHVQMLTWDGKALPLATVQGKTDATPSERADASFTQADWPIVHQLGRIPLSEFFLIAFIVVFALVIGPLNLFVFANAARRHRLFWTTPVISVAASLLLAGFIILQDGFGGSGQRVMFCLLLPEQKQAVVFQEQVCRTGVLLARQFTTAEDLLLMPVQTDGSSGSREYERSGRNYVGDWFASRSVQAQRVEAIVPSRAEIQLLNTAAATAGEPPVITSSIPAVISEIRYCDPSGRRWRGENLRTGERITLRPSPDAPIAGHVDLPAIGGSKLLDTYQDTCANRPGYFVAFADDAPFFATLPSIHWKKQQAVFAGAISSER